VAKIETRKPAVVSAIDAQGGASAHAPESHGQKVRMIQAKKHRARHKAKRGRVSGDE
jgi:hypothetical protein